jgi:hypothetical protein
MGMMKTATLLALHRNLLGGLLIGGLGCEKPRGGAPKIVYVFGFDRSGLVSLIESSSFYLTSTKRIKGQHDER